MKGKQVVLFTLITLLIFSFSWVTINGVDMAGIKISPMSESVKLGLDIQGGVVVIYEAQTDLQGEELQQTMEQTQSIISRRVNELGLMEPVVTIQGLNRIRIELPGVADAEEALEIVGQTALLEFIIVDGFQEVNAGDRVDSFTGRVVFTGQNVRDAFVSEDQYGRPAISLRFDDEGEQLFEDATREIVTTQGQGLIAIALDGEVITAPLVSRVSARGEGRQIVGNFTYQEAFRTSMLIRGGALPVELEEARTGFIGPRIGVEALESAITAAKIGLILLALYLVVVYKVPGLIASIALVLFTTIVISVLVIIGATLTIPGVIGIVLSLGMAVDANVIIFERIKEEIAGGKSLRASVHGGFHRAMRTIIDSNVTTFIAAIVLFTFGEGPIKGFAITLMIGILSSMLTAVALTRSLLMLSLGFINQKSLYGARRSAQ